MLSLETYEPQANQDVREPSLVDKPKAEKKRLYGFLAVLRKDSDDVPKEVSVHSKFLLT